MARAAALALLEKGPAPLPALYQELKGIARAEVDAALLQLEQEQLVLFTLVPTSKDKVKIFYRSGKDETSAKDQASSTPSPQPAAAAKVISPALKERLDRKRALTSPATGGDAKRKQQSPLEQEEGRLMTTIKLRKSQLEDLKRKKVLAEKSANPAELERLQKLSVKWGNASRELVRVLQPHVGAPSLGDVLKALRIPPAMLGYSAADDDFTKDFTSLDKIDHEAEAPPPVAEDDD